MLNSIQSKQKRSKVEGLMNVQIINIFALQIFLCIFSAIYATIWQHNSKSNNYLLIQSEDEIASSKVYFFTSFGSWLLIFTNFVPISLLVTLEMVKFFQASILQIDNNLKCHESGIFLSVQSSNLNEELGQVKYIFSDKTGTLTKNQMDFKKMCIGGISYGEKSDVTDLSSRPIVTNVDFADSSLFNAFIDKSHPEHQIIKDNLFFLAICHAIVTENKNGKIIYNAASPDELALVNFAKFVGVEYMGLDDQNNMQVLYDGKIFKYQLLYELEFNSTRKRMSVLVKDQQTGQIQLLCKGADSIIMERMIKNNAQVLDNTNNNLTQYSLIGLRTLLLAKRIIPNNEYDLWQKKYHQALTSMTNREELVALCQEEIEVQLELVGATAIEDKLQDEVGETIDTLKKAGIQVWVLTGDKIETAINIGYSCKLLNDDLQRILIDGKSSDLVMKSIDEGISIQNSKEQPQNQLYAMVLSGDALIHVMNSDLMQEKVIKIGDRCNAVIACRVSPLQKQEVVALIRKNKPNVTTLAIGDGANDVQMITAAHVGIGLRGVEGQQAARASDYALGEFKLLKRLLLYVGRESYRKNTHLILYNFYKNILIVIPQLWYAFYNGFTGVDPYDSWIYQLFNLMFTALPIISYSLLDEEYPNTKFIELSDQPKNFLETNPKYYSLGMNETIFTHTNFWTWMFHGAWNAMIVTFFTMAVVPLNHSNDGKVSNLNTTAMIEFFTVVIIANLKISIFSNTFNFLNQFFLYGSILCYVVIQFIFSSLFGVQLESYNIFVIMFTNVNMWLVLILSVSLVILIDLALSRYYRFRQYFLQLSQDELKQRAQDQENILEFQNKHKSSTFSKILQKHQARSGYAFSQDEPIGISKMINNGYKSVLDHLQFNQKMSKQYHFIDLLKLQVEQNKRSVDHGEILEDDEHKGVQKKQ